MDEPKTATAIVMQSMSEQMEEHRKRLVAAASAQRAMNEWFNPDEIEDMRDAQRMATRAAEFAAYYAMEKLSELLANDMALLRQWQETQNRMLSLKAPDPMVVAAPLDL